MLILSIVTKALIAGGTTSVAGNSDFSLSDPTGKTPLGYELKGAVSYAYAGYRDEISTKGILMDSCQPSGSLSEFVDLDRRKGKWIKFRVRARAEDGFAVGGDQLYLQIEFFANHGQHYEDQIKRLVYRELVRDRKDLAANGNDHKNGAAVWRSYDLEELLPFAETDRVKLTFGFSEGAGKDKLFSRIMVNEFRLDQEVQSSDGRVEPVAKGATAALTSTSGLVGLGGRWFYQPIAGENFSLTASGKLAQTLFVTEANSSRLYYKDERLETPFRGNMTAWLRKGFLDLDGNLVKQDRFLPDNVTVEFDGSDYLTIHARNIPNHPTARFPDTYGTQGYNPSYIQEHDYTWKLPIAPKLKKNPLVVDTKNTGMALPMGATGIAVNGVVFYNPFDAGMQDASGIMDRCCGHPSPDNRYHYHKYPICVNTPFADKGEEHSGIIGFAFDGLPIYGPYESAGVMAKDSTDHPLNAFNAHYDAARGWHYHVTPGKFPYVIGGYFGQEAKADFRGFGG